MLLQVLFHFVYIEEDFLSTYLIMQDQELRISLFQAVKLAQGGDLDVVDKEGFVSRGRRCDGDRVGVGHGGVSLVKPGDEDSQEHFSRYRRRYKDL